MEGGPAAEAGPDIEHLRVLPGKNGPNLKNVRWGRGRTETVSRDAPGGGGGRAAGRRRVRGASGGEAGDGAAGRQGPRRMSGRRRGAAGRGGSELAARATASVVPRGGGGRGGGRNTGNPVGPGTACLRRARRPGPWGRDPGRPWAGAGSRRGLREALTGLDGRPPPPRPRRSGVVSGPSSVG